jgi:type III secretion protein J
MGKNPMGEKTWFRHTVWLLLALACAPGCSSPIQHGLDEAAANEIVTSLERAGLGASKTRDDDGAFVVSVGRADVIQALELMRSLGLPRAQRSGFGEIYKQPSLVPTPTEDRARYSEALAGEIARTLETVDGVVSARVHLVLPEPDPLALAEAGKPRVAAQAAVLLKTRTASALPIREAEVQKLVAGSVPGLEPAAVAVVTTLAPELPSTTNLVTFGPLRMSPDSRGIALAGLIGFSALVGLLAILLLLTGRRLSAAQRKS